MEWGELGIDLPEYLGLMVRCLVEWSRGNVGFDRSGVLGYWLGGMLGFVIRFVLGLVGYWFTW